MKYHKGYKGTAETHSMKALFTFSLAIVCQLLVNGAYASNNDELTISSQASTPQLLQQRANFATARSALKQGRLTQYRKLAGKLTDYPLYPYLEYWDINRNLNSTSAEQISTFLERNQDLPVSERLQHNWLKRLAQQGRWQEFAQYYDGSSSPEMKCYYRRAQYKTGNKAAAFEGLEELWLVGKSQPRACDPLFSAWQEAGYLSKQLVWQRIVLALNNGQVYLARYLERFLDNEQRQWSKLWRDIHRHPEKLINHPRLKQDIPIVRTILAHGIRRMTRNNPSRAADVWDKLVMAFAFSEQTFKKTEQTIAVALARKDAPEAMHWLGSLDSDAEAVREWRILTSLNHDDWEDAIFWIYQLPQADQQSLRWRYWLARALEETGKPNRARMIYAELAKTRDYYGFLAADKIGARYDFEDHPLTFSRAELAVIENLPGMLRAREFYQLDDSLYASREWYATIKGLNNIDSQKVARITHEWGWHNRAIHSLGEAKYLDDLEIRFPLAHKQQIHFNAARQKVDPSWAYAVIRQESAFAPDARSPKGAMGLMQIMPSTGRLIARDLNTQLRSKMQLLDANTNIRFGISYLRKVMNRFDDNTVLATAAYNAGSQRVKSWLPEEGQIAPDIWIENIPFKETRNYLKQVLAFSAIYDERQQRPITPLQQRMPPIQR